MSETKPIIEWLKELPTGYRERAISQCVNPKQLEKRGYAISYFALWSKTKEGFDFWSNVNDAWNDPDHHDYPPLPDDGGPQGKPERDTRLVARVHGESPKHWWTLRDIAKRTDYAISADYYTRRSAAKRGLIRFLRRLGVDENAVRWEGAE